MIHDDTLKVKKLNNTVLSKVYSHINCSFLLPGKILLFLGITIIHCLQDFLADLFLCFYICI